MSTTRFRQIKGRAGVAVKAALVLSCLLPLLYVLRVNTFLGLFLYPQQVMALFLGFMLVFSFLLVPIRRGRPGGIPWYDYALAVLSTPPTIYVAVRYPDLMFRVTMPPLYEMVLATIMVVLIFEAVRRQLGLPIVILAAFFVFHTLFSNIFPGVFHGKAYAWSGLAQVYYTFDDGVFGIVLRVMATVLIPFIVLGEAIMRSGGGNVLMDLSMSLVGRFRGGAAKAATVVSAAFGSISGSPSANVAVTGVVTIPLMKQSGYSPTYAGAVEATASTGGNILPPVMGAVAFVIAEYLQISYADVVVAAFLPAILYYVAVFTQVDLQAGKLGLKGLPRTELPPVRSSIMRSWWILLPFTVLLIFLLKFHYPTDLCGAAAIGSLVLLRMFSKEGRVGPKTLISSFEGTARSMLMIATVGALAGIIIGSVTMSGLGANISMALVDISGGNVIVLLVLTGVACIILGMGMPVITAYIMLAILIAPALVQLGINPLAAHLFIFYFATISFITPPVCIASYIAAGIAGASPFRVGFQAVRLAIVAVIVPFVFVFQPHLLMDGSITEITIAFISAVIGTVLVGVALEGFLFRHLIWVSRIIICIAGIALMTGYPLLQVIGVVVVLPCILTEWRARQKQQYEKIVPAE